MEWLGQIRKLTKAKEYAVLDTIDGVLSVLWLIEPAMLGRHKDLLNKMSTKYHKNNPLDYLKSKRKLAVLFKERNGMCMKDYQKKIMVGTSCPMVRVSKFLGCASSKYERELMTKFVEGSLSRCESGLQDLLWQWFEVIDFMYEHPEQINPALIDEYITNEINTVCREHGKNNPLTDGTSKRFGKFWQDKDGTWKKEKRHRF
jgi:hypothetical protein